MTTSSTEGEIRFAKWFAENEERIAGLVNDGAAICIMVAHTGKPIDEQLEAAKLMLFNRNVSMTLEGSSPALERLLFAKIDWSFRTAREWMP